jgi:glycosyltransferase involved in cell wall biosynthesis
VTATVTRPVSLDTPVFSPSPLVGGVERVGRQVQEALGARDLYEGWSGILRSPRPAGRWTSLTWKTHAAAAARHPGTARRGSIWLHGAELTRDQGRAGPWLRDRALHDADQLLAVSPLAVELLPDDLRERTQLIGPPVPLTAGLPREQQSCDVVRLLSIGRAEPRKGHDLALRAAAELSRTMRVQVDVVGPGPDLPRLDALAAALTGPGLHPVVHGGIPQEEVDRLYAEADVLLFLPRSEQGEFEGLGLVMLEAAAYGCPAVVLDCGGSRFGVADGRSGHVLPAGSTAPQIALAAAALAMNPAAREDAAAFAACFALSDWQDRVRAVASGHQPGWHWPSLS